MHQELVKHLPSQWSELGCEGRWEKSIRSQKGCQVGSTVGFQTPKPEQKSKAELFRRETGGGQGEVLGARQAQPGT